MSDDRQKKGEAPGHAAAKLPSDLFLMTRASHRELDFLYRKRLKQ